MVAAACPWMGAWLCLMMQPSHLPLDSNMLLEIKAKSKVIFDIFFILKMLSLQCVCVHLEAELHVIVYFSEQ